MKRIIGCIIALSLLLSGCNGLLDSSYIYVTPHQQQNSQTEEKITAVSTYAQLLQALRDMVENGTQSGIFSVAQYEQPRVDGDMRKAITHIMTRDPVGAYAVSEIHYDLGTSAGQPAVSLDISYLHDRSEIRKIQRPADWEGAEAAIAAALNNCDSGIVLYVTDFQEMDFAQWVASYAALHPDRVMEQPEVSANLYPDSGDERVVELKFAYQNSRDSLRIMQTKVGTLFEAAEHYVSLTQQPREKFSQMYSFLMERFETYQMETSITPAYSLLQHGVGDSRAFAIVYAAMCNKAGLECITVTGTKAGEPRYWNIVCIDGVYCHVDLLECNNVDDFITRTDAEMTGYVWDYSAYPACTTAEELPATE